LGIVTQLLLLLAAPAWAVRPFVTDDARVVGERQAQIESWIQFEAGSVAHWLLASIGPAGPLEFGIGATYGVDWNTERGAQFTMEGPLLQAKLLLVEPKPNRWPGVAVEGGTLVPLKVGQPPPPGWSTFALVALTESLFAKERLLIHGNLGFFHSGDFARDKGVELIWGLGMQLRAVAGLHVVAEIFSGDPYAGAGGGAAQVGLRYILNEHVQIDATVGKGVWGDPAMPVWGTAGLRVVGGPWGP
jgi:hypothetical protein